MDGRVKVIAIDTNVFIEAKNFYDGFDLCPAFWEWIIEAYASERVFSVERVGDELERGEDELSVWAAERGPGFFLRPTADILSALGTVSDRVIALGFEPVGIEGFLQAADYYLIAQALAGGHEVVTRESPSNSRKRIKIPNVCIALGVRYLNPFEMLRREGVRFVLGSPP